MSIVHYDTLEQIGETSGPRLIEVYVEGQRKRARRFYIVSVNVKQGTVCSYLRKDHPYRVTQWSATYSARGITSVAKPMTEKEARYHWARIVEQEEDDAHQDKAR